MNGGAPVAAPTAAPATDRGRTGEPTAHGRRALTAAAFGTVLEWYDFFLYGTAAVVIAIASRVATANAGSA